MLVIVTGVSAPRVMLISSERPPLRKTKVLTPFWSATSTPKLPRAPRPETASPFIVSFSSGSEPPVMK